MSITLTMQQIIELADFAGLVVDHSGFTADDMETEFTITNCPPEGLHDEGEPSDSESRSHYKLIAYYTEYPDEGCIGLGPEIPAKNSGALEPLECCHECKEHHGSGAPVPEEPFVFLAATKDADHEG